MNSKYISAAVVAVAALTGMNASAEAINQWLIDQMNMKSSKTRAEVRAEMLQAQQAAKKPQAVAPATATGK